MPYGEAAELPDYVKEMDENKRSQWKAVFNSAYQKAKESGADTKAAEAAAFKQANGVTHPGKDKKDLQEAIGLLAQVDFKEGDTKVSPNNGQMLTQAVINLLRVMKRAGMLDGVMGQMDQGMGGSEQASDEKKPEAATKSLEDVFGLGEKMMYEDTGQAHIIRSFEDFDKMEAAMKQQDQANKVNTVFQAVFQNIMHDPYLEAGEKAELVTKAAQDFSSRIASAGSKEHPSFIDRMKGVVGISSKEADPEPDSINAFVAFKDHQTGQYRWLMVYTNRFYDKAGEVFPEAAHKEFEAFVDQTEAYPVFRIWHTPAKDIGLKDEIGVADFLAYDDAGFMVASGLFRPEYKDVAERLADYPDPLGCSHGYYYFKDWNDPSVISKYRTFELTVLPLSAACNKGTTTGLLWEEGSKEMAFSQAKREFLSAIIGDGATKAIEDGDEAKRKQLVSSGVGFKDAPDPANVIIVTMPDGSERRAVLVGEKDGEAGDPATQATPPASPTDAGSDPAASFPPEVLEMLGKLYDRLEPIAQAEERLDTMETDIKELKSLAGSIASIETAVKSLTDTDEAKIAAQFSPARRPTPASQDASNVVHANANVNKSVAAAYKAAESAATNPGQFDPNDPIAPFMQDLGVALAQPAIAAGKNS